MSDRRLVGFLLLTCLISAPAPGQVTFSPERVDFGTLRSGAHDEVKRVSVVNGGSEPVSISGVYIGCGCMTAARLGEGAIPPGGSAEIAVTLHAAGMRPGSATYPLQVSLAGIGNPSTTASYRFDPYVLAAPESVRLEVGPDPGPADVEATVRLQIHTDAKLTVTEITASDTAIHPAVLEQAPDDEGHQAFTLTVRLTPGDRVGRIDGTVTLRTDRPELPQITVPVLAEIAPPVRVMPQTVVLGRLAAEPIERTLTVESARLAVIASARSDNRALSVQVIERLNAQPEVLLRLDPGLLPATQQVFESYVDIGFSQPRPFSQRVSVRGIRIAR